MTKDKIKIGLSTEQAQKSAELYGTNKLAEKSKNSFFKQFISSFNDPIIKILLASLIINIIFRINDFNPFETFGMAAAVLLSTLISASSEYGSEKAYRCLLADREKTLVTVYRDGRAIQMPSSELVVGDAVVLRAGEKIYADGYIMSGQIQVDQSPLNGEGEEVTKIGSKEPGKLSLSDNKSLFSGSLIVGGEGCMTITSVGQNTYYGSIASELSEKSSESPLKEKLAVLAKTISRFGYFSAILVACADLFNTFFIDLGFNLNSTLHALSSPTFLFSSLLHALTLALTVVIVAVPEGLPMMIGVVLSRNINKMKEDNVMVRRPVGIETSGGINILFTDKTGTLTYGKMSVESFLCGDGKILDKDDIKKSPLFSHIAIGCLLGSSCVKTNTAITGGSSSDRALYSFCCDSKSLTDSATVIASESFSSDKKFSSVTVKKDGKTLKYIKGAPDLLLPKCKYYLTKDGEKKELNSSLILTELKKLARQTLRGILLMYTENGQGVFVGILQLFDAVRKEAKSSVKTLTNAGVDVVMITGDGEDTALAVCKKSGIYSDKRNKVITGAELEKMSDGEIKRLLPSLCAVARAYPSDKSRLVRICKESGLVVGMTGDGINDSPALRRADVGFAMGSGTAVAKEAGDIIIADDNISSITKAVLYGRTIFRSIRKFLTFQLTMNFCAVAVSLTAPLIGCETPVTVVQMLWINIIMDTLAALAFAGEEVRDEYMTEPPTPRKERVLSSSMKKQIVLTGLFTVGIMIWYLKSEFVGNIFSLNSTFYCGFFGLFVFSSLFNCLNIRTHKLNLFSHLKKNKSFIVIIVFIFAVQLALMYFGGDVFRCTPLCLKELLFILSISFLVIPFDLIRKALIKNKG